MNKETRQSMKEIATVTAVGAVEGAAIGFATGMGFLSLPGYAAGGIIGGLTALTAELAGRIHTQDITVSYTVEKNPLKPGDPNQITQSHEISRSNVPDIKRADVIFSILPHAIKDIATPLRDIQSLTVLGKEVQTHRSGAVETRTHTMNLAYPAKKA